MLHVTSKTRKNTRQFRLLEEKMINNRTTLTNIAGHIASVNGGTGKRGGEEVGRG